MLFRVNKKDIGYLHWWFLSTAWFSPMKLKRASSVIDWRSTNGRRLSSRSIGVVCAALASLLPIHLATKCNWRSPPMLLIEGNRRTSFIWPMFNFNVKRRGMSVDSRGTQAVMRAELLVDCAISQMPSILSTDRLWWNLEGLIGYFSEGRNDVCTTML